jgi:adenylate cyclase
LDGVFALQDEISSAVVDALKLRLLPQEKLALDRRDTESADAYRLYLQARAIYVSGDQGDRLREDAILRLCRMAVDIDPAYARAWALLSLAHAWLSYTHGDRPEPGEAAADRALALAPDLAEAHAVKAKFLAQRSDLIGAFAELAVALRLDPNSYEANETAGLLSFQQNRFADAIGYYKRAAELMESDFGSAGMLIGCCTAIGEADGARIAARQTAERCERALAQDAGNGSAIGFLAAALAVLGDRDVAKAWMTRALVTNAENPNVRYNFACALCVLGDEEAALKEFEAFCRHASTNSLAHAKSDPDLSRLHRSPRFAALLTEATDRLAAAPQTTD